MDNVLSEINFNELRVYLVIKKGGLEINSIFNSHNGSYVAKTREVVLSVSLGIMSYSNSDKIIIRLFSIS